MSEIPVHRLSDLQADYVRWAKERDRVAFVNKGAIVLPLDSGSTYEIPLREINTPARIIHWVMHLSQKRWVDKMRLERVIELACGQIGMNPWQPE